MAALLTPANESPAMLAEPAGLMSSLQLAWQQHTPLCPEQSALWERFMSLGLPHRKQDPWRQMDLRPLTQVAYQPTGDATMSLPQATQSGVTVSFLQDLPLAERAQAFVQLSAGWATESDSLAILNGALLQNALLIDVPEQMAVEQPIRVAIALPPGAPTPTYLNARIWVRVRTGASVTLMLDFHTRGNPQPEPVLTNCVLQIQADANAQCQVVVHHNETALNRFVSSELIHAEANAQINITKLHTGEGIRRIRMVADLAAPKAHIALNGLVLVGEHAKVHQHWVVNHGVPNATSQQLAKAILTGHALNEFNGTITVAPGANGTDARQMCQGLLLSDNAKAIALPQLRIEADDVKCAHGATIGQLDAEPIFYLVSRGFTPTQAQRLLLLGFVDEVTDTVQCPSLRQACHNLIRTALRSLVTDLQIESPAT
jgi:Fe-S cluster assembly protein SufD